MRKGSGAIVVVIVLQVALLAALFALFMYKFHFI